MEENVLLSAITILALDMLCRLGFCFCMYDFLVEWRLSLLVSQFVQLYYKPAHDHHWHEAQQRVTSTSTRITRLANDMLRTNKLRASPIEFPQQVINTGPINKSSQSLTLEPLVDNKSRLLRA